MIALQWEELLGNVVMQLGFAKDNFDEAEDGLKPGNFLAETHYDVILTDWNIPNIMVLNLKK